ncbi:hypothetical protein LSTR_LSTR017093 [Laodelphax striatellus]|uniref:Uncharacterized protein n=1 Tax=Laodelphax striatellus TaxID=195883 RepID=A0A482XJR3_LAOST|nr:hypothetical protein LSTR_LSTR017093 [Laodelphax striatellus]
MAAKKVECVSDVPSCLVLLNSPTCPTRHSLSLSPFPRVIAPCSAHDDLFSLHQGFVPPGQPPSPSSAVFSLELLLVAAGSRPVGFVCSIFLSFYLSWWVTQACVLILLFFVPMCFVTGSFR